MALGHKAFLMAITAETSCLQLLHRNYKEQLQRTTNMQNSATCSQRMDSEMKNANEMKNGSKSKWNKKIKIEKIK